MYVSFLTVLSRSQIADFRRTNGHYRVKLDPVNGSTSYGCRGDHRAEPAAARTMVWTLHADLGPIRIIREDPVRFHAGKQGLRRGPNASAGKPR